MDQLKNRGLSISHLVPILLVVLVVVILSIISLFHPQPPGILNVDPEQWATSGHLGLLSKVSTFLWLASAIACGYAAHLLRDRVPAWAKLFGRASALNWVYLLCDFFLIHEAAQQSGVPRWMLYVVYSILALSFLSAYRPLILQTDITMLGSACIGLGLATLVKVAIPDEPYYIIEGVKLAGLTCWSAYFCRLTILKLRDPQTTSNAVNNFSIRDAVIAGAIVTTNILLFVGLRLGGIFENPYELVKEPTILLNMPLYVGLLSNIGVLLIASGGIGALLATFGPSGSQQSEERQFLLYIGAFVLWLSIDDYYLLHERTLMDLGIPQAITFTIYGLVAIGILLIHRKTLINNPNDWHLLVLGVICLGGSVTIDLDLFWLREIAGSNDYLEDALKLVGLLCWSLYLLRRSITYLDFQMKHHDHIDD